MNEKTLRVRVISS